MTPDTILRWHRQLIARKWTYAKRPRPASVLQEIKRLVVRMAEENPTWGDTRIRDALKNVGDAAVMRTLSHELGQALNLFHNDGDATGNCCVDFVTLNTGHSIMNQKVCLAANWALQLCQTELDHLLTHPIEFVMPGNGVMLGHCIKEHQRLCQ